MNDKLEEIGFDKEFYLKNYPDIATIGMEPLEHYLLHGKLEKRFKNFEEKQKYFEKKANEMNFDSEFYYETYPDIRNIDLELFEHYLEHGQKENRFSNKDERERYIYIKGSGIFDDEFYINKYADVVNSGLSPLMHFSKIGCLENRTPNSIFDPIWYKTYYKDVNNENPILHYIKKGMNERRFSNENELKEKFSIKDFDFEGYLLSSQGLLNAIEQGKFMDAFEHLISFGLEEIKQGRRQFHTNFEVYNEVLYQKSFPELWESSKEMNSVYIFEHFCRYGYKEIINKTRYYPKSKLKIQTLEY